MSQKTRAVDPALWEEFTRVAEAVRARLAAHERREREGIPLSIPFSVSPAWLLLASWMEAREAQRKAGKEGPTGIGPDDLNNMALMRRLATRHIHRVLEEYFRDQLEEMAADNSWRLYPEPPPPDLETEIPF
jgi:hypothetical protein